MRRWLLRALLLGGAVLALWASDPPQRLPRQAEIRPVFPPDLPTQGIDGWLMAREGRFADLTPGTEKTVVWAGDAGARTPLALVYLHGFSASRAELEPVPQIVARALGANLFLTRLAGHGRPGAALAEARLADWAQDLDEAMGLGRRLGTRVVLIGTSAGGSLAALAALDPDLARDLAGVVLISPAFAVRDGRAWLLDLPHARRLLPWFLGPETGFTPQNPDHERYWTTRYPSQALASLRALQRQAGAADYAQARVPMLALIAEGDRVADPEATRRVAARWGAPARVAPIAGAEDPQQHVLAGRILSPGTSARVAELIAGWIAEL